MDPKMLELLVCPLTKGRLRHDEERNELVSEKARIAYPIRDGIPIMLVSEAREIED
ncbi:Trm112 family protein [Rhizobium sp. L1K21]|uniref:Trm112 family protein n=1 Tax=Rhizobium sp. L1K21 TaxID=2954933 RepID=UPI002093E350|nr:Trm112 family protein [Rhizobium sp. L1K21]MCO6188042.1 Trm112 family protein [Rhizobium sp. L1K21]